MANAQVVPLPGWGVRAWHYQGDLAGNPDAWSGWQSEAFMYSPDGSFFEHSDEYTVQIYSATVDVATDVFTAIPIDIGGGVTVFVDGTYIGGSGNDHFVATFNLSAGMHIIDLIVNNGCGDDGCWTVITVGKCLWGIDPNITFVKAGREETTSTTVYDISDTNLPGWGARGSEYNPDLHNPENWGDWKSEAFMFAPDGSFFEHSNEYTIQIYSVTVDVTADVVGHAIPIDIGGHIDVFLDGNLVAQNGNAHFDAVFDLPIGTHVIDLIVSNAGTDPSGWTFVGVGKCLWGTDEDIVFVKAGREVITSPTIFDLRNKPLPNWRAKGWAGPDWGNFKSEGFMFAPDGSFFECAEENQYQLYSVVVDATTNISGHVIPIDIDGSVDLFLDGNHLYHEENTHFDAVIDIPSGRHKIELSVYEIGDRASIGVGKCLWGTDPNISFVNTIIAVPVDYPTIQAGIDAANPGDTVMVAAGIYNENITISKSGVKLQGSGAGGTIINGGGIGSVIKMSGISDIIISGFTITNGLGDGQDCCSNDNGGGIAIYECSNITIRDNVITQNYATGENADGGGILIANCAAPIVIAGNTITDNHPENWGGGICIQGTSDVRIERNDISNNDAGVGDGISLWSAGVGASALIINNRIANNQGDGIYISDGCSAKISGNRDYANDIIGNIGYAVRNDSTTTIDATYNFWGTTLEWEIQGAIYDYYDDPSRGVVDYNPWLGSTHEIVTAQALSLDGNGDLVEVRNVQFSYQALTLEAWIYMNDSSTIREIIGTPDNNDSFQLEIWEGQQIMFDALTMDTRLVSPTNAFKLRKWHHIAGVYDGTTSFIYVDGKLVTQRDATGSSDLVDAVIRIGSETNGMGQFWYGLLDEIRIWNIARTQEEIQDAMNRKLIADEINSMNLVGYWNFDDGTANDSSLYGNHGTIMGDAEIVPLYGTWPPPLRGDVSGNGTVSAYDASLILQYVVGLIDEFPADRMGSPSAIEPHDYELSLPNVETPAGGKIQVPIAINDATGLLAGGITIKYDPTVLRAVDYAPLKLLNGYYWKANTNLPGEVRFAFATTEVVTTYVPSPLKGEGQGEGGRMLMVEFEVLPNAEGMTSPLILENVNLSNSRSIRKIDGEVRVIPSTFALLQNFPNPFNPDTWIPYKLASASTVSISIYNAKGQLIRTLHLGYQNAGVYVARGKAAYWDGKDNVGEKVSSGVYFYTLQTGKFISTRKMVIMK